MSSISSASSTSNSIEQLVAQYMAFEKKPLQTIETKKASLNTLSAVYSDLKNKLQSVYDAAQVLSKTGSDSAFNTVKVTSSDAEAVSVATDTDAAEGQYVFRVRQLATATTMKSTATLNNHASVMSSTGVVSGTGVLDIDETWADAGFDAVPDGTVTINGAVFTLADYTTVEDFMDAVNDDTSVRSHAAVTSGGGLDTSQAWADAGFDTAPDGTVTINGRTFTLTDYATVDEFIAAVNADATANVTLTYSAENDRFTLTSDDDSALTLSETGTTGFLTAANITGPAKANLYYDESRDKFVIESTTDSDLVLAESGSVGFFTEANIATGTYSTNTTGLNATEKLANINFDTDIAAGSTGSFKINGVTIEWNADTDTLASIISDINRSEAGVTAFYDDTLDKLILTSDVDGSEAIELEDVEGSLLTGALKLSSAAQTLGQDAKFTVNSTDSADEITKSSNNFTINGISFTLNEVTVANDSYTDSETTSVTVKSVKDESAIKSKVSTFLTAFNTFSDYIKTKTAVDTTTYTRGVLAGDTVYRGLRNTLSGLFSGQVSGLDAEKPSYLSDIGITMDDNLHLSISDATTFSEWLTEDPEAIANLFNSDNGVAVQVESILENYVDTYGIIYEQKESISDQIGYLDKQIERLNERLAYKESYYRSQFTSLQQLFVDVTYQMNQTTSMISSMNSLLGLS